MSLLRKLARNLPALLGIGLLVAAIWGVGREFRHLRFAEIKAALQAIPPAALALSFGWTVLSYSVLTFYDRLGTIYAGHKVSYARASFASFCAYALAHNLGFAAVSGAAVRYRLYAHWGLTPLQIAKVVAFCSLTFGLGGMVLGGTILFIEPGAVPFFGDHLPHAVLYGAGGLLFAVVLGYVTFARIFGRVRLFGAQFDLPGWRMAIVQVVIATADVAVTAAIFHTLLPPAEGLTYLRFLAVYLASYTAGLLANLPGGIGVFDTAMLFGLSRYMPAPPAVGAILVFRLFYYVIPLFLAGALFAGNEIMVRGGSWVRGRPVAAPAGATRRWSEPDFAVAAATGAVALCGTMLLSLSMLEPRPSFPWIGPAYADVATRAGQYVPSLIGAGLLVLAVGLSQRVTLAWGATIALLLLAAAFTGSQGGHFGVAGVLILAALLIAPFRDAFYRHARLLSDPLRASTIVPLFALVACVLMLAAFRPRVQTLARDSWWQAVLSPEVPNSIRFTILMTVVLALIAIWRLIRPGKVEYLRWDRDARLRYVTLGGLPPERADGLLLGELGRAAIPFRRLGRVMVGLGDPAGAEGDRVSTIWRLRDLAQQEGLDPAIWNASPQFLNVCGDIGLTALPLGPDGRPLREAPDAAPPAEHYLCCVAERDLKLLLPLLPDLACQGKVMEAAE